MKEEPTLVFFSGDAFSPSTCKKQGLNIFYRKITHLLCI